MGRHEGHPLFLSTHCLPQIKAKAERRAGLRHFERQTLIEKQTTFVFALIEERQCGETKTSTH